MPETASEVEKGGDKRVGNARVVYAAVVAASIDGDEGLVWL
jgi:hypothetical protein